MCATLHLALAWLVMMAAVVGALGLQRAGRGGRRPHFDRHRRGRRALADPEPRGARIRARGDADPDLVSARRLGGRRRRRGARLPDQRPRRPGLVGGLVLIVMLIGFTVMQFAFSGASGGGTAATTASGARLRWPARAKRSSTGTWSTTRSAAARRSKASSAEARRARGAGRGLARRAASARPRPLLAGARRAPATALRPHQS